MTQDPCYIWILIIGVNMRFHHTKSTIHSPGHSHSLFTSARDCESAHWTLLLHIPVNLFTKCQYKTNAGSSLTVPRVCCKQLWEATMEPAVEKPDDACGLHVESLTRNESTCACPAKSYSDISNMAELPSFWPPASESTLQYRTSPLRQTRMRPKLKAAPAYI